MLKAGQSVGLRYLNLCVWDKGVGAMGSLWRSQHELCFVFADSRSPVVNNVQLGRFGRTRTNVWPWPGAASLRKELLLHPTPKPVGLLAEAIRDVTNRGDIVLDCFSGSGSTIIAAATTGRRGYAIELDPHYVEVGIKRWERWSGQTADSDEARPPIPFQRRPRIPIRSRPSFRSDGGRGGVIPTGHLCSLTKCRCRSSRRLTLAQ